MANTGFQSANWAIRQVSPLLPEVAQNQRRMRWLSMLNGVLGDHLVDSGNPLALSMAIMHGQQECTTQQAAEYWSDTSKKPLLMVHGLCLNEKCWQAPGRHGEMLAGLGHHAPLYLRYNSGLAINENGRQLSERLNHICAQMPFGQGNTLSDQEAVDIAAYFTHLPRPVKANKDKDWPNGDAPKDVRR